VAAEVGEVVPEVAEVVPEVVPDADAAHEIAAASAATARKLQ